MTSKLKALLWHDYFSVKDTRKACHSFCHITNALCYMLDETAFLQPQHKCWQNWRYNLCPLLILMFTSMLLKFLHDYSFSFRIRRDNLLKVKCWRQICDHETSPMAKKQNSLEMALNKNKAKTWSKIEPWWTSILKVNS